MGFKQHYQLMAGYNQRMNNQVYAAAAKLDENILTRDSGAFFGSILGTLNHIMVADLVWLGRYASLSDRYQSLLELSQFSRPKALSEILYADFNALSEKRRQLDSLIIRWLTDEVAEEDYALNLHYSSMAGAKSIRNFGELLAHFFNHQTHHRGQASTLLSQAGQDIGVTDFVIDIPDLASSN
ncbi:uncharacterized protein conserved in bacteria [Hahella chejuensis KCTC 2396]|uniref:Uncharacterized protein conserved in bacteria n=1 Tax=Hahella chejuensis (strain KCTC 2396) TaxID=349521 RepID=Q2SM55_HAHCH|nr:DinB family protein [Hahella chejuensis]ABC28269.1 uncharacterized protein conserved in bacteria [Hahella chejuensis KCTC 2396]